MNILKSSMAAMLGLFLSTAAACQSLPPAPDGEMPSGPQVQIQTGGMDGYRLGTGDEIRITIFDEPSLSGAFTVDGLGLITMNLAGPIEVKNLTLPEAETAIETKYRDSSILRAPRVTAEMVKGRPFYISGEVNRAGVYPFTAGLTVINAIAAAGDFTYRADKRKIMVTGPDGVEREVQLTPTTPVHPGDRIRIRERLF